MTVFLKGVRRTLGWILLVTVCHAAGLMTISLVHAAEGEAPEAAGQSVNRGEPESDQSTGCSDLRGLLEQQKAQLSREMGQLKREMALLREDLAKPGLREIFAGIGYILGLAGVGLYAHCRKSANKGRPD